MSSHHMEVEIERKIVSAVVKDLLKAGFRLSVSLERGYDLDEMLLGSTEYTKIMREAFAGDECHIFVHEATGELIEDGRMNDKGYIYLVFGNGPEVLSDWTTNLDSYLARAQKISDHYLD